jgi:O-antigen ligase
MNQITTGICAFGILGLFMLDRDRKARISNALWLPFVWLLIIGSRPVSVWLQVRRPSPADLYLEGSPLDRNIYLVLIATGVFVLLRRRTAVGRFLRANPSILLFATYCGLSISWSDYPDVAFKRWIKSVGDFVMLLIVLTEREPSSAVKRIVASVGFVLFPLSILLIKYYPDMGRYYSAWEGRVLFSGVGEDKNMLGMTCLVFGLAALWRLLGTYRDQKGSKRTRRLIAHGTALAMVLRLLWLCNSMTSISCFVLAGSLIAITSLVQVARRPPVVHLMVAVVVSVPFSTLFLNTGGGALETIGRDPTLTGRTEIWKGLLLFTQNSLLGTGFSSFWLGERLRMVWGMGGLFDRINEAHNAYLEVFLNLGWIGVCLLAVLILTGYRTVIVTLRRDPDAGRMRLAFFVTAVVYGFTEAAAFGMTSPVWFGFLLATTVVPNAPMTKPGLRSISIPPAEDSPQIDHRVC